MKNKQLLNVHRVTNVIAFTKVALPYGWLGNMAPFPLVYDGQKYLTSEREREGEGQEDRQYQEKER